MPRAPKLKVFRMAVGFHDAYVAAPSQKAAIEAWGSDKDVFQRGQAELVTDPALTREPLAHPGEVVKRLRGTAEEQIAALDEAGPPGPPKRGKTAAKAPPPPRKAAKPRPSRAALEATEAALAEAAARHAGELKAVAEREAALARERKALETKQRQERERLETRRSKAEAEYREAMRRWREG